MEFVKLCNYWITYCKLKLNSGARISWNQFCNVSFSQLKQFGYDVYICWLLCHTVVNTIPRLDKLRIWIWANIRLKWIYLTIYNHFLLEHSSLLKEVYSYFNDFIYLIISCIFYTILNDLLRWWEWRRIGYHLKSIE